MLRSQHRPPARLGPAWYGRLLLVKFSIRCFHLSGLVLIASPLPPARGAPQILLLSSLVATLFQPRPAQSWLASSLSPSQSTDRCLPEAWHRTPLRPLWAAIDLPAYSCPWPDCPHLVHRTILRALLPIDQQPRSLWVTGRHRFASLGWVYSFRPISDQESKTAPQCRNFRHE